MTTQKHYAYFSAAIRDGSRLAPQGFGLGLWLEAREAQLCAIEAGIVAMDGKKGRTYASLEAAYPYLQTRANCPVPHCERATHRNTTLSTLIWLINDDHKWSRERIAEWLYAEEEKLGFVTVLETQDTCAGRGDSNVTKDSPASESEKVFV